MTWQEARARRDARAVAVAQRDAEVDDVLTQRAVAIERGLSREQAANLFPMPARLTRDGE